MSIERDRLNELLAKPLIGEDLTDEGVILALTQHVEAGAIRTGLLEALDLPQTTPNRELIERVQKLVAEDAERDAGNDFGKRVTRLMTATHMSHDMAVQTIVAQDRAAQRNGREEKAPAIPAAPKSVNKGRERVAA